MTPGTLGRNFRLFWDDRLSQRLWSVLQLWHQQFDSADDARLIGRSFERECVRNDIDPEVWLDFFRELVSISQPRDAFQAIDRILAGAYAARFFLPGRTIPWSGDVYHYERLDRLNEQTLKFPVGGDRLLERLALAIESGACTGTAFTGRTLGRENRPYWVTNFVLAGESESNIVRNRLGLRSLSQPGYRLVEIRYSLSHLVYRDIPIKAPTVLDAWQDGARRNWIFTKAAGASLDPEPGRTVDLSRGSGGGLGPIEAVHKPIFVFTGDGSRFHLRVLRPITEPPPELSLVTLLENPQL